MVRPRLFIVAAILTSLVAAMGAKSAFAQEGKLKIRVTPKQAYVFVDGSAIRDGKQTISLSPASTPLLFTTTALHHTPKTWI